jgi:nucleoside-diphosphate-sugar epimerase
MKIFVTGASGYIGGTIAAKLVEAGHEVKGLVRSIDKAEFLTAHGIEPTIGTLDDAELLAVEAQASDAVVNAANADHTASVQAFIKALQGTGRPFIHTSGSSVIGDDARGNSLSSKIYDELTAFDVAPAKLHRHELNQLILRSADQGVRSIVICPSHIYGDGRGANPRSLQIPFLLDNALTQGVVEVVGRGVNRWSHVHIDDLAELYLLALEGAPAGSFYFAESGEASFSELGEALAQKLGMGPVRSLTAEEAVSRWGERHAYYTLGSNSRVRAGRARKELGWHPRHTSAVTWINDEMSL